MSKSLKSNILQEIVNHLINEGYKITFEGQAWSNTSSTWIYFDTHLKTDTLIKLFDKNKCLKTHQNDDPRSGREKGLIDPNTEEGVMGLY